MTKYLTATQARKSFFKLIELLQRSGMTIMITHQDKHPIVMMSAEEWEGWMETLDILSNPEEAGELRTALKEYKSGTMETVDWEDVKKEYNLA
jgi:antitoxin YefM